MFDWVLDTPVRGNIEKDSRGYCSVIINSSMIIKSKEDFSEINIESIIESFVLWDDRTTTSLLLCKDESCNIHLFN